MIDYLLRKLIKQLFSLTSVIFSGRKTTSLYFVEVFHFNTVSKIEGKLALNNSLNK
jgi:hypothetical protein